MIFERYKNLNISKNRDEIKSLKTFLKGFQIKINKKYSWICFIYHPLCFGLIVSDNNEFFLKNRSSKEIHDGRSLSAQVRNCTKSLFVKKLLVHANIVIPSFPYIG